MKRTIFKAALVILALVFLAYISLVLTVNSATFQDWIRAEIAHRTGYDVSAREIRLDPLLRLSLMEVTASSAANLALQVERIIIVPSPATLFSRTIWRLQLEKPVLSFDIYEFFDTPKGKPPAVSIRQLIVKDGTLILRTGKGSEVNFRSVAMSAENFNLGEGIGVKLRTAVPWLDGIASITIEGGGTATEAVIRLEQKGSGGITELIQTKNRQTMETKIKLTKTPEGSIRVIAEGKLDAARFAGESFSGEVSGSAETKADLKEVAFAATVVATEIPAKSMFTPVPLPKGQATLKLRGNYELAAKNLSLLSMEVMSSLGEATGQGQMSFDPAPVWTKATVRLRKIAVDNFKPMLPSPMNTMVNGGAVEADLEIKGPWRAPTMEGLVRVSNVKLHHEKFSLGELNLQTPIRWADGYFRAGDIRSFGRKLFVHRKNQIEISAEAVHVRGTLEKNPDGAVSMGGTLQIQQGAFASADGAKLGEKLALEVRVDSLRLDDKDGVFLAGKLDVAQGEVLWGKFYGDLKSQRPMLEFDGEYRRNGDLLHLRRASLALASVGKVAINGDVNDILTNPVVRLAINSDAIQCAAVFEFFIRETLNRSYPILDRLGLAGLMSISAKASGPLGEANVDGTLTLSRGELRAKSNDWHLVGIEIVLPFRLSYPAALSKTSPVNVAIGTLNIESAKFGTEIIRGIKSSLSLWNNLLRFHQPVRLPIYSGSLVLSNLAWKDIIATPKSVSLSLEAKSLQLRKLTESLGWYRFGGTLSGSIPKIEWTGNSLRSQGQIDIAVFGGLLRMSELEIETPFSSVPSIKLNARLQNIQLEQASETFAFGRISGVLEGTVSDLAVTEGQPSMFSADIYSVEKSGVSQRISVESLNKITVLSSGQEAGALYSGIAGFFDSFRYSKLGLKAMLKNDRLTLRGVETHGGQEYLVVGSFLPPSVNVVSHTQEISFSELVRRLERIQKSEKAQKTIQ